MLFNVPDMSCGHCTAAIEAAIKAEDPAATVNCDLDVRQVAVETALPGDAVATAMAGAGYAATPVAA